MKRIKILFVIDSIFHIGGGSEGQLSKLINRLDRDEFEVHLAALCHSSWVETNYFDCPKSVLGIDSLRHPNSWRRIWQFSSFIRDGGFDIVQTYFPDSNLVGAIAGRWGRARRVISAQRKDLKVLPIGKETKVVYDGLLKGDEIILRMDNLNSIKRVVPEDLYVIMDAGYDLSQINETILSHNLFFPFGLDGIKGTLVGAVASGLVAGNGNQKIYIKDYVLSLEIIDGDGEVLNIGANVFKSVAGYDTTRLFVGSWGSLGVVTEVGLRLVPLNRKKEFENMKFLSPRRMGLNEDSRDYNTVLSLRLKEALDPKKIFLSL